MNEPDGLIQPFRGVRPRADLAAAMASPPYDVLDSDEARQLAVGRPYSFLHVSKAEIDLDPTVSPYDPQVYAGAANCYRRWRREGVLIQDERPVLYLYRLTTAGPHPVTQTGVVAALSVAAYLTGRIKRHELTRPDKERDRTDFAEVLGAHSGPAFLVYRPHAAIDRLVTAWTRRPPWCQFTAEDGVEHTLWVVDDSLVCDQLVGWFEALPSVYIADGHHRTAAAAGVRKRRQALEPSAGEAPWERFLAVLFPSDQVTIRDYNRVVRDLNGLTSSEFLTRLAERFLVVKAAEEVRPDRPGQFGMVLGGDEALAGWYRLELKSEWRVDGDLLTSLDVNRLNVHILDPLLGITDLRRDSRIDFVGGSRGLRELAVRVASGGMAVAFALFPTALADLMAVADAGQVMPPKSTWFEPKLRDGLIIQEFSPGHDAREGKVNRN